MIDIYIDNNFLKKESFDWKNSFEKETINEFIRLFKKLLKNENVQFLLCKKDGFIIDKNDIKRVISDPAESKMPDAVISLFPELLEGIINPISLFFLGVNQKILNNFQKNYGFVFFNPNSFTQSFEEFSRPKELNMNDGDSFEIINKEFTEKVKAANRIIVYDPYLIDNYSRLEKTLYPIVKSVKANKIKNKFTFIYCSNKNNVKLKEKFENDICKSKFWVKKEIVRKSIFSCIFKKKGEISLDRFIFTNYFKINLDHFVSNFDKHAVMKRNSSVSFASVFENYEDFKKWILIFKREVIDTANFNNPSDYCNLELKNKTDCNELFKCGEFDINRDL